MSKQLLFSFEDLSEKSKAVTVLKKAFTKTGQTIVQVDVLPIKRTLGVSYRTVTATFADSQTLALKIKASGDIYEADVNGKAVPVKNQDDHAKAVAEISKMLDAGRTKFQAALAKALVKLPPSIRTAVPKLEAILDAKIADLTEAMTER